MQFAPPFFRQRERLVESRFRRFRARARFGMKPRQPFQCRSKHGLDPAIPRKQIDRGGDILCDPACIHQERAFAGEPFFFTLLRSEA